jgi:hypothetical protein
MTVVFPMKSSVSCHRIRIYQMRFDARILAKLVQHRTGVEIVL